MTITDNRNKTSLMGDERRRKPRQFSHASPMGLVSKVPAINSPLSELKTWIFLLCSKNICLPDTVTNDVHFSFYRIHKTKQDKQPNGF